MPLPDITNPAYIKFFIESCEKTARLRQKWNLLNQKKLQEAATLTHEDRHLTDMDVIRENILGGVAAITRDHISSSRNRRRPRIQDTQTVIGISSLKKGHTIPEVGLGDPKEDPKLARPDTDLTIDPIMRPVDPELKKIIFKPKPVYGREVYIRKRNRISPEDKFYFPEVSGWDYGWRLKDTPLGRNAPKFGKVYRLRRDQMCRVGPQPDPHYYTVPAKAMVVTCESGI